MDLGGLSWALQTVIGVIILAAALVWAILRNRKSSQREIDRTEKATHDLYEAEDRKLDDEKL